jgi:uncharacterized membrane protein (UPF0127 family)
MWKLTFALAMALTMLVIVTLVANVKTNEGFASSLTLPVKGTFMRGTELLFPVNLEVARTPKEIERGLMNRTSIPPHTGMLFWFENEAERAFWMHKTLIPLDMIFVTSAGRITNIIHSAPPENDTLRKSTEPVQYVVELPGGTAEKYGLQAGDRFLWTY